MVSTRRDDCSARTTIPHSLAYIFTSIFLDAPSISVRGFVRPSVGPSVHRSVRPSVGPSGTLSLRRERGASYAEYSALFKTNFAQIIVQLIYIKINITVYV